MIYEWRKSKEIKVLCSLNTLLQYARHLQILQSFTVSNSQQFAPHFTLFRLDVFSKGEEFGKCISWVHQVWPTHKKTFPQKVCLGNDRQTVSKDVTSLMACARISDYYEKGKVSFFTKYHVFFPKWGVLKFIKKRQKVCMNSSRATHDKFVQIVLFSLQGP